VTCDSSRGREGRVHEQTPPGPLGAELGDQNGGGEEIQHPGRYQSSSGMWLALHAWPLKASILGGKMWLENGRARNEVGVR